MSSFDGHIWLGWHKYSLNAPDGETTVSLCNFERGLPSTLFVLRNTDPASNCAACLLCATWLDVNFKGWDATRADHVWCIREMRKALGAKVQAAP